MGLAYASQRRRYPRTIEEAHVAEPARSGLHRLPVEVEARIERAVAEDPTVRHWRLWLEAEGYSWLSDHANYCREQLRARMDLVSRVTLAAWHRERREKARQRHAQRQAEAASSKATTSRRA